ncbi:unnamed protein product [Adineta steineri]|uniref:Uncharacterized protein n=1 Tax=Adineta steineri TaxID=433720 RepID=A0A814NJJ1_9BILA|nr:unnamed protein product [Adineta steineri]CAF3705142.1 unnamed protein product [Adineta steineri]
MGANTSNLKTKQNLYSTPPKTNNRLLFDPRSPSDGVNRTPIHIDNQAPIASLKLYNHVMPYIVGPDISIPEENKENTYPDEKVDVEENEPKRISDIQPTLDPTITLTALIANNNGQLPPYQL